MLVRASPNGHNIQVNSIDVRLTSEESISDYVGTYIFSNASPAFLCSHLMLGGRSSMGALRLLASVSDYARAPDMISLHTGGLTGPQLQALLLAPSDALKDGEVEATEECLRDWASEQKAHSITKVHSTADVSAQIGATAWRVESMAVAERVPAYDELCGRQSPHPLLLFVHVSAVRKNAEVGELQTQPLVTLHVPLPRITGEQRTPIMITSDSLVPLHVNLVLYDAERYSSIPNRVLVLNNVCHLCTVLRLLTFELKNCM